MIETFCACQKPVTAAESQVGTKIACATCGSQIMFVAGEAIEPGMAIGDFDARLVITEGPEVGRVFALGGVPDLEIGKATERKIQLFGTQVSRAHAKLSRLDFGPSRWQIEDTKSRNGVFVNDQQISKTELRDGDKIRVGEFELTYFTRIPIPAPVPITNGVVCPGCHETYSADTKVCVTCGIDIKTGRPLVTSRGLDENDIAIRTDTWVGIISWILWFGLFPIASEAFGTKKAKSIWWIAGITIGASLLFFIPYYFGDNVEGPTAKPWVMWAGSADAESAKLLPRLHHQLPDLTDDELKEAIDEHIAEQGHFHIYQLITQALVHAGILHLAGNMVFMLVFGLRVNELIGNMKMAIVYPVLAVSSALIYLFMSRNDPLHASLGASGAIMGLAGMYFVFFPMQKVHIVIWFRGGLLTGWRVLYKNFRMRGFWLLFLWLGLNDVLPTVLHGNQTGDGVAHWAHLGGFISGVVIALGLLISRQASAHGSDLLSVALGPVAWKIVGRPATATE